MRTSFRVCRLRGGGWVCSLGAMLSALCMALTPASASEFAYGFEAPAELRGLPGEEWTLEIYGTLTTTDADLATAAQAWQCSVFVGGGSVESATLGVEATLCDLATQECELVRLDTLSTPYKGAFQAVDPNDPERKGAVTYFVLPSGLVLQPEGAQRIFKIVLKVVIPAGRACGSVLLQYEDGFKGAGTPVTNIVTSGMASKKPFLGSFEIRLCPDVLEQEFTRGDTNGDGEVDIGDAVFVLTYLFAQGELPSCMKAADANASAEVDIADAIYLLSYLFSSGPAPAQPFPECGTGATDDGVSCEAFSACQ
jgi:hypothetical protein